jgi:hypothetical protein
MRADLQRVGGNNVTTRVSHGRRAAPWSLSSLLVQALRVSQPVDWAIRRLNVRDLPLQPPPIFIVGAPRSGSTVLYQTIASSLDVSYTPNLVRAFPYALSTGLLIQQHLLGSRSQGPFESVHGRTRGLRAPAELGRFWYRWFPRDRHFVAAGELSARQLSGLRREFQAVSQLTEKAYVVKNLNCGQRIQALHEALPEALWIYCRRDPALTAYSIWRGRQDLMLPDDVWWSVMPPDVENLRDLPIFERIARQVHSLERQTEADLELYPASQRLVIWYEDLCANPRRELDAVRELGERNGVPIRVRSGAAPLALRPSRPPEVDPAFARIRGEVDRLDWSERHPPSRS